MTLKPLVVISVVAVLAACGGREATPAAQSDPGPAGVPVTYDETLEYAGISFHVRATGDGATGNVTITPAGLEIDNSPMTRQTEGQVVRAEAADLNVDNSPEVYVYTQSAGRGAYGGLIAYAANRRKSLSEIYLPPMTDNPEVVKGYRGHDEFWVIENTLVRRFPVYKVDDPDAAPTGGTRQLQYKLKPGEAGWVLKVDRIVEY